VHVPSDAVLGEIGGAGPAIAWGLDYATVTACAEMVGIMDGLLWLTRDYLRQRRQYGVALSSLQALQHRLAEMFAELELSRSMLDRGLQAIAHADRETRHRLVSVVKAYVSRSGRWVGHTAIQLHGGIGLASEYKASRAFRRLLTLSTLFGTPDEHLQRR
jgi:alkylation response protein AidB-like acyl-CoA dehydrogenase